MAGDRARDGAAAVRRFPGGAFDENGYLVACTRTGAAILVDPGAATPEMLDAVRAVGARVQAIVLTHAHVDHLEGVARAKAVTGAPIFLHPEDDPLYAGAPEMARALGIELEPLPPVDGVLVDGSEVRFGHCRFQVRHAPGHSPGHVVLIGAGLAFVGDVIFRGSIGRTDLPGGDLHTLLRSVRGEILTLPDDTVLYCGHGPETTVHHERRTNPLKAL